MVSRLKEQHVIFDTEIIGQDEPVFLVCVKIVETGETQSFWHHKKGDLARFLKFFNRPNLTWVGFNSAKFDNPLLAAWVNGRDVYLIKKLATQIIEQRMQPWEAYRLAGSDGLDFDHIDLIEVAPGVMVSLKTYAGRMNYPSMVDLPFHHDQDLTNKECKVLESYCLNDLGVTEALFKRLTEEIELREQLGDTYDLELRSKSGPQVAEAILKKMVKLDKAALVRPEYVTYSLPTILKIKNKDILHLVEDMVNENFAIDTNGSPVEPVWMEAPFELHGGQYKVGIGGLHSQHDKQLYVEATDDMLISDFDVASYYPNIMMKCELVPKLRGKGEAFIEQFSEIYRQRMEAKVNKNKAVSNALKLCLNGTYGKLGSIFSSFYAPDLMLAVCLTGQLNLLNLIDHMAKMKGVKVLSANTDGITVQYPALLRDKILKVVSTNAKQTGFEYEETRYSKIAMKDVNNYLVVKLDGGVKAKGLYAPLSLEKNPTAPICALAAAEYLVKGTKPATFIKRQRKLEPFLSIRAVKGGGVQHTKYKLVDDWEYVEHKLWVSPSSGKKEKRVSRPEPFQVGIDGKPFGRVARWYMSNKVQPSITYCSNGNQVPKTEGAQLCMTLPSMMPLDIDHKWYINETNEMLAAMGVDTSRIL